MCDRIRGHFRAAAARKGEALMGYQIVLDHTGYATDGPTTMGMKAFREWVKGLPMDDFYEMHHFVDYGLTDELFKFRDQLEEAIEDYHPNVDVVHTARTLIGVVDHYGELNDVVMLTSGDTGTEEGIPDPEDEEAEFYDPDEPRDEIGRWTDEGGALGPEEREPRQSRKSGQGGKGEKGEGEKGKESTKEGGK
jgi:hypothetical protein